jgi:hypothetical protein
VRSTRNVANVQHSQKKFNFKLTRARESAQADEFIVNQNAELHQQMAFIMGDHHRALDNLRFTYEDGNNEIAG